MSEEKINLKKKNYKINENELGNNLFKHLVQVASQEWLKIGQKEENEKYDSNNLYFQKITFQENQKVIYTSLHDEPSEILNINIAYKSKKNTALEYFEDEKVKTNMKNTPNSQSSKDDKMNFDGKKHYVDIENDFPCSRIVEIRQKTSLSNKKNLQLSDFEKYKLTSTHLLNFYNTIPVKSLEEKTSLFDNELSPKKYFCTFEQCETSYPTLSQIKRHFIMHTNLRPFKCTNKGCYKQFSRLDSMKRHSKKHCTFPKK